MGKQRTAEETQALINQLHTNSYLVQLEKENLLTFEGIMEQNDIAAEAMKEFLPKIAPNPDVLKSLASGANPLNSEQLMHALSMAMQTSEALDTARYAIGKCMATTTIMAAIVQHVADLSDIAEAIRED